MKRFVIFAVTFVLIVLLTAALTAGLGKARANQPAVACQERLLNGGAEQDTGWSFPVTPATAGYSTAQAHGGTRSIRVGIIGGVNRYAYSSALQHITIPVTSATATLNLWLYLVSTETAAPAEPSPAALQAAAHNRPPATPFGGDAQYVFIMDEDSNLLEPLLWTQQNANGWQQYLFDLSDYIGQTIVVLIGTYNDGLGGVTGLYLDDASLLACDGPDQLTYVPLALRGVGAAQPAEGLLSINGLPVSHLIGHPDSTPIYGLTPAGLYRSNTGAANWALMNTSPPVSDTIVIAPGQPDTLYGGTGYPCYKGGDDVLMWKSEDGGQSWDELPAGRNLQPLAVHPQDADRVYARGCDGPWLSLDGGLTWQLQGDDLFLVHNLLRAAPASADNWQTVYLGTATEGGAGALLGSDNGGTDWAIYTPPNVDIWAVAALIVDPISPTHLYFAEPHAFWGSSNGGTAWYTSTHGLADVVYDPTAPITHTYGLYSLTYLPGDLDNLLLGTVRGLYGSDDRGHTWAKLSGPPWQNERVSALLLRSAEPTKLFVTTPSGVYVEYLTDFPAPSP
jgi:photosystem II stability/assembly factor-like uncharacterized protein